MKKNLHYLLIAIFSGRLSKQMICLIILFCLPFFGKAQTITTYPRTSWTVSASSEQLTGEPAPSGPAAAMLDGNNASYWVSNFTDNFEEYPHTLIFDMHATQPVNQIYYVPRDNNDTSAYSGSVSFSDNGTAFGTEIPVVFSTAFTQSIINLPATQTHRYFRITINQNNFDHINGSNALFITTMAEVGAIYNSTLDGTLSSFTVQSQAGGVQLNWATTQEINATNYSVTRSNDALNFTSIGTVAATGSASTPASYTFTDTAPLTGINFYRLELANTTGPATKSVIKNAEFPLVNYSSTQSKNLNLFYFLPAGKAPWIDFKSRIDGVFLGLQDYYKNEMQRNGRGNKTFSLVTDATHTKIKLIIVHGKHPFNFYSTNPGGGAGVAILAEINDYMAANPSPFYGDHNQIITPAFGYNATTGVVDEQIPVYGDGRNCYSLDYPDLKWNLLGTGGPIGYAATLNIGGTAHEAGHGLNLSHNHLKVSETPTLGTALMADGNETFGLANTTTSITGADAAILNHNQVFNDSAITYYGPAAASVSSISVCYSASKNAIVVKGTTTATNFPITDVAIYNDPDQSALAPGMGANKDYDAVTWTAPVTANTFYLEMPITDLQVNQGLYEMKVRLIQQNGTLSDTYYHYSFASNLPLLNDPAFTPITATVTASTGANGIISPVGVTTISCAGNQTYTITPNSGFAVQDVLIDGVSVGAVTTYTFNSAIANHTITATFIGTTLPITWNGSANNSWNVAANWTPNTVPTGAENVLIASGTPSLNTDFTLGSGKTLTINGSGNLTVEPNRVLKIAGTANFNDKPILFKSDATGTGIFGELTGFVSGVSNVTVQRYIFGRRAFRFLSPGVTSSTSIFENWQNNGLATPGIGTQITGGTSGGFDVSQTNNPSLHTYNALAPGNSTGFTAFPNTNVTQLKAGVGYRLLVRGDRNVDLSAASANDMNVPTTLSVKGTLKTGPVTFDATSASPVVMNNTDNPQTNGYTLIGNPYVSPVDWHAVTKTNVSANSYYTWDPTLGTNSQRGRYVVYSQNTGTSNIYQSGIDPALNRRYLQSGQAVFVKSTTVATPAKLTFSESNKVNNSSYVFRSSAEALTVNGSSSLYLSVFEPNELAIGGNPIDGALALFGTGFVNALDSNDVDKLNASGENIAFARENKNLAIEALAPVAENDELFVKTIQLQANKNYTFKVNTNNFDTALSAKMVDLYLNNETPIDLTSPSFVTFSTSTDAASYALDRFKIVFNSAALGNQPFDSPNISIYPNPIVNNEFTLVLPNSMTGKVTVSLTNMLGQIVYSDSQQAVSTMQIAPKNQLQEGIYIVNITNNGNTVQAKVIVKK